MKRPMLWIFGAILILGWIAAAAFLLVDPLEIYPWGIPPKLDLDRVYSGDATRYLVDVVAKNSRIDTLLLGGSTSQRVTARMMETILPGTQHAFNLSYSDPNTADREAVEQQILRYARPRHVILELNWHYQRPRHGFEDDNGFPLALYDGTVWNAVREIGINTLWLTVLDVEGKPLWLSDWSDAITERHFANEHRDFVSPASLAAAERVIERHKHDVDYPTQRACSDFDAISGELLPFAQALAARHVALDIIIPPYSLYIYYFYIERDARLELAGPTFMNDQLKMRACAVKALASLPNVRFFAFDNVPGIADNFANYYNAAHIANVGIYEYILQSVAKNQNRLTAANVDGEIDKLRARILGYHAIMTIPWQPPP